MGQRQTPPPGDGPISHPDPEGQAVTSPPKGPETDLEDSSPCVPAYSPAAAPGSSDEKAELIDFKTLTWWYASSSHLFFFTPSP